MLHVLDGASRHGGHRQEERDHRGGELGKNSHCDGWSMDRKDLDGLEQEDPNGIRRVI